MICYKKEILTLHLLMVYFHFFARFNTYKDHTMPIIKYYEERQLVKTIPAMGTPDEVSKSEKKSIEK